MRGYFIITNLPSNVKYDYYLPMIVYFFNLQIMISSCFDIYLFLNNFLAGYLGSEMIFG